MQNFSKQFLAILFSCSLLCNGVVAQEEKESNFSREKLEALIPFIGTAGFTALISFLISAYVVQGKNKTIQLERELTKAEREQRKVLEKSKTDLQNELDNLKTKIEDLKNKEQEFEDLSDQIDNLNAQRDGLNNEIKEKKQELADLTLESEDKSSRLDLIEKNITQKQEELDQVNQSLKKIQEAFDRLLKEVGSYEELKQHYQRLYFRLAAFESKEEDRYNGGIIINHEQEDLTTSVMPGQIVDTNLMNSSYVENGTFIIERGDEQESIEKTIRYVQGSLVVEYKNLYMNAQDITCDYIIVPINKSVLLTDPELVSYFDNFVDYIIDQGRACKVVFVSCTNDESHKQALIVCIIMKKDGYAENNIFAIVALGSENLQDTVCLINDFNDSSLSHLENSKLLVFGADVSCLADISRSQFDIINLYNKNIKKGGYLTSLMVKGGGNKVAEGISSLRKCIDMLLYTITKKDTVIKKLEPLQVYRYGLGMLKDLVSTTDKPTSITGVFTNLLYVVKEELNEDNKNILTRYREIRSIDPKTSINTTYYGLVPVELVKEELHKSMGVMQELNDKYGITGDETVVDIAFESAWNNIYESMSDLSLKKGIMNVYQYGYNTLCGDNGDDKSNQIEYVESN